MLEKLLISPSISISDTLKQFNSSGEKVLLVTSGRKLKGVITDGDIRRAVLSGSSIDDTITGVFNREPTYLLESEFDLEIAKSKFLQHKIDLLPIVNKNREVIDYISWSMAFSEQNLSAKPLGRIDLPVVIMAGGKGTRLEPLTTIIPKPLIPVGTKTIVEHIMERFITNGVDEFYFTLNYLGEMIKAYLNSVDKKNKLYYVFEKDYFGTAGSLKLLEDRMPQIFIVSNCDILVNVDYSKVLKFHKSNHADLTMLSAFQRHRIPYGVIEFKQDGVVTRIHEKPEKTVVINTGVYVLNLECLHHIPGDQMFHMTDLIDVLMSKGKKVCTYPVNEDDYIDIGQWDEYRKAVKQFT
ncbi:MAG: NTP transferase domain-containing protein [Deltaproteobacteria bacterium]|nr:NTP transferase domain-containing protein [Deltaproteobacteria bacterium]